MKKIYLLLLALCTAQTNTYFTPCKGPKNETFCQARKRFEKMTVREVNNLNMCTLSNNQFNAFKDLAESIFRREIASAGCFSQANRRKYEVMYQKLGDRAVCRQQVF